MKKNDIIVTDFKDAVFASLKYEKYTVEEVDGVLCVVGSGRIREDKFKTPDKRILVSLLNLSDDLLSELGRYNLNCGTKGFTSSTIPIIDCLIKNDHNAKLNWIARDEACQKLILAWCDKFGLVVEEALPGSGFELEPFLYQLFKLNKKFNEVRNNPDESKTYKYVMSGKMIYSLDIVEGVPEMSIVFPSVLELAWLQFTLSLCNKTDKETVLQCGVCHKWFAGNAKMKYCGNPCTKMTAYRKNKKNEESKTGVKA